jgi:starvation-inducible outer membrane lipoprotein
MLKILSVSFFFLLSGCVAAPLVITGVGVASVAVNETTGKTITDQTVSAINGQDCRVVRAFKDQDVCQPTVTASPVTTTGVKPSSVAELEARYRRTQ